MNKLQLISAVTLSMATVNAGDFPYSEQGSDPGNNQELLNTNEDSPNLGGSGDINMSFVYVGETVGSRNSEGTSDQTVETESLESKTATEPKTVVASQTVAELKAVEESKTVTESKVATEPEAISAPKAVPQSQPMTASQQPSVGEAITEDGWVKKWNGSSFVKSMSPIG